jgi:hypothetical protein
MNTKYLLTSSALCSCCLGVAASFFPQEILRLSGISPPGAAALYLQVAGGLFLGFAMLNWMSRAVLIGGIYARPLAMGNFLHYAVGGLALLKGAEHLPGGTYGMIVAGVYSVFAILFGIVLFRTPSKMNG